MKAYLELLMGIAIIVLLAAYLWVAEIRPALAQEETTIQVPVDRYQLGTGDFVVRWIDDEMGVICWLVTDNAPGVAPGGVSCLPLDQTSYGWPARLP